MTTDFQDWVARVSEGLDVKHLAENEIIKAPSGQPYGVMNFYRTERKYYVGEVGKKHGDYIFHFFLVDDVFPANFEERMGDAFLKIFKMNDRLESTWTPELNSYAVRARGFATNIMADELALKVFDELDHLME